MNDHGGKPSATTLGRLRQMQVYISGIGGKRPRVPVAPEAKAARAMNLEVAAYIIGSAGSERTMRANRAAFDRHQIVPRVLRDVSERVFR
jgi:lactate 2-monooxygenase